MILYIVSYVIWRGSGFGSISRFGHSQSNRLTVNSLTASDPRHRATPPSIPSFAPSILDSDRPENLQVYVASILIPNFDSAPDSGPETDLESGLARDLPSHLDRNLDSHQDSYFGSDHDSNLDSCLGPDHGSSHGLCLDSDPGSCASTLRCRTGKPDNAPSARPKVLSGVRRSIQASTRDA